MNSLRRTLEARRLIKDELGDFFRSEMTTNADEVLDEHKHRIIRLASFTPEGTILLKPPVSTSQAGTRISAYLITKAAARIAGVVDEDSVGNVELEDELGIPGGTVSRILMELRTRRQIYQIKRGLHRIVYNRLPDLLDYIERDIETD